MADELVFVQQISFDQMAPTEVPSVRGETSFDQVLRRYLPKAPARVYLLGQKTAAGTADALTIQDVFDAGQAGGFFGHGSELHEMAVTALSNPECPELRAIAVEAEGGAVKATASGTLNLSAGVSSVAADYQGSAWIGPHRVTFGIEAGWSAGDVFSALQAAVNGDPDLPVSMGARVVSTGAFKVEAKNAGVLGNELTWAVATGPKTETVLEDFGAGAGNLDLDAALAVVRDPGGNLQPTHIVVSDNAAASLLDLRTHIEDMQLPSALKFCYGFTASTGTLSAAVARSAPLNDIRMLNAALRGAKARSHQVAAAMGVAYATESDPARPRQTLVCYGIDPPTDPADNWDKTPNSEADVLIRAGVAPLGVNARQEVEIIREASTMIKDSQGLPLNVVMDMPIAETADRFNVLCLAALTGNGKRLKKYPGIHKDLADLYAVNARKVYREEQIVHDPETWLDSLIVQDAPDQPGTIDVQADPIIVVGLRQIRYRQRVRI